MSDDVLRTIFFNKLKLPHVGNAKYTFCIIVVIMQECV